MGFSLVVTDRRDKISIGCFSTRGDLGFWNRKEGAGALDTLVGRATFADAGWEEAAKLIGSATNPNILVGSFEEGS